MSYNHGKEEKKFVEKWQRLRDEYRKAGMSEDAINLMYEFDREVFNRDRAYYEHQHEPLEKGNVSDDEMTGGDYSDPIEEISVIDDSSQSYSRYWWIEEIENPLISAYIKQLSQRDIEMLTMFVFEGYGMKAIGEKIGLSPSTVCYRITKIKKIIKNISDFRI